MSPPHASGEVEGVALLTRFSLELERVGGEIVQANGHPEAISKIIDLVNKQPGQLMIVGGDSTLTENYYAERIKEGCPSAPVLPITGDMNVEQLSSAALAVISASSLIAATGTAVLVTSSTQPRSLMLLPETLIIIARASTITPNLTACLERLSKDPMLRDTSSFTLLTGPSRTADIEKTLVMGVHGPKRVMVIVVEG